MSQRYEQDPFREGPFGRYVDESPNQATDGGASGRSRRPDDSSAFLYELRASLRHVQDELRAQQANTQRVVDTTATVDPTPVATLKSESQPKHESTQTTRGQAIAIGCAAATVGAGLFPIVATARSAWNVAADVVNLVNPFSSNKTRGKAAGHVLQDAVFGGLGALVGTALLPGLGTAHGFLIGAAVPNVARGLLDTAKFYTKVAIAAAQPTSPRRP